MKKFIITTFFLIKVIVVFFTCTIVIAENPYDTNVIITSYDIRLELDFDKNLVHAIVQADLQNISTQNYIRKGYPLVCGFGI